MKLFPIAAASLLMVALVVPAATSGEEGVPASVHYIDHETVSATMAKGGRLVSDPGLVVEAQRRKAGLAEYHERTNHIFIMVEGEATLVIGGKLVEPKQTAPNEIRGTAIEGGETYHVTKGDVITIPAKTPHWWKDLSTSTIAYYAVNISSQ